MQGPGNLPGRHGASPDRLTQDAVQTKRGHEARDDAGLLDHCTGPAVHDPWQPSCTYDACRHARREDAMVQEGCDAHPRAPLPAKAGQAKQSGRRTHTPPRNLLRRLRDCTAPVVAFLDDFRVPFDTNQAARDSRMVHVTQQGSGGCRTREGAKRCGRMRGSLSTARQQTTNIFAAISDACDGTPFMPAPDMQ